MDDYQTSFEKQGERFLQEKRKDTSGRKVNVVVVDIKGQTISQYVQNDFDLSVCTITTNGTQITIPQPELLSLKHSIIRKDPLAQRRAKYANRGFLFV
jgi:sensor histidine kinase YesM